jgi:hypothetical protein
MQLSQYIEQQLDSLLREVQATPPKRYTSMQKIATLVDSAPMGQEERERIANSLRKVEDAIRQYSTPQK